MKFTSVETYCNTSISKFQRKLVIVISLQRDYVTFHTPAVIASEAKQSSDMEQRFGTGLLRSARNDNTLIVTITSFTVFAIKSS
jgi:hypothetical protein